MMEIEMPKIHPSQQDIDLIDILWRQDIDLGAGREVFDYCQRQKEHELQQQREQEEDKRLQQQKEQEKALLAQLQLDEETGEFVPRLATSGQPLQTATSAASSQVIQDVSFTVDGDAMSFDECMQLLAETFPLVEATETTSSCLDAAVAPAPNSSHIMMKSDPPALTQLPLLPAPLPPQRTSPDLEQAWMELLSLPELQQCLNMEMEDTREQTGRYLPTNTTPEDPNYSFYPLPNLEEVASNTADVCPPEFINTFEESFPNMAPLDHLSQMTLKAPDLNTHFSADTFCDVFYPDVVNTKVTGVTLPCGQGNGGNSLAEIPNKPTFRPMELQDLSPVDTFDRDNKPEIMTECPDSDSGVSVEASSYSSSPEKSMYGDRSFGGYSDSDMDEMDSNPGSAQSDYSEMFSLSFQPDGLQTPLSVLPQQRDKEPKHGKTEPDDETGHSEPPFTKDKKRRRSEKRLSRDEQRAKALQIPFTVDMIIELPVDDFNEMMSKHQLNEAQLALVRDIRRRGKNKVAAQNCRKRKMENITELEYDLDSLKEEKERLQTEKTKNDSSLRKMKQQLNTLYLEVFRLLRDEDGKPYSPLEYSLQQTTDGTVFLVPRIKKTLIKKKDS
ncbi:nuclear factor erythroid 2-related factor 2-like [Salvelinus namaycush]|uniref:Nuclear factor erythroid 2-related factor 2-like n=1 Tax=Salvelinus namaycush TaxID=8040 RepID=A0A8U1H3X5_SALNM|nr:nuclear factor erythroid 2-related factor 2-like [Salvelinus namaycush]